MPGMKVSTTGVGDAVGTGVAVLGIMGVGQDAPAGTLLLTSTPPIELCDEPGTIKTNGSGDCSDAATPPMLKTCAGVPHGSGIGVLRVKSMVPPAVTLQVTGPVEGRAVVQVEG